MNTTFPNSLVIPSSTGSLANCVNIKLPSIVTLTIMVVIYWLIFLAVAFIIYYFVKRYNPNVNINYWIILLILLISGLLMGYFLKI